MFIADPTIARLQLLLIFPKNAREAFAKPDIVQRFHLEVSQLIAYEQFDFFFASLIELLTEDRDANYKILSCLVMLPLSRAQVVHSPRFARLIATLSTELPMDENNEVVWESLYTLTQYESTLQKMVLSEKCLDIINFCGRQRFNPVISQAMIYSIYDHLSQQYFTGHSFFVAPDIVKIPPPGGCGLV